MSINLITGYDLSKDECGQTFNKAVPTIKTAVINEQIVQEIKYAHNNKDVISMY